MSRGSRWAAVLIVVLGAGACQLIAGIDDRELAQPNRPGTGGTPNVGTGGTPTTGASGTPILGAGGSLAMAGSSGAGGAAGTPGLEGGPEAAASDATEEMADATGVTDAPGETTPDAEGDAGDATPSADAGDATPSADAGDATPSADAADAMPQLLTKAMGGSGRTPGPKPMA